MTITVLRLKIYKQESQRRKETTSKQRYAFVDFNVVSDTPIMLVAFSHLQLLRGRMSDTPKKGEGGKKAEPTAPSKLEDKVNWWMHREDNKAVALVRGDPFLWHTVDLNGLENNAEDVAETVDYTEFYFKEDGTASSPDQAQALAQTKAWVKKDKGGRVLIFPGDLVVVRLPGGGMFPLEVRPESEKGQAGPLLDPPKLPEWKTVDASKNKEPRKGKEEAKKTEKLFRSTYNLRVVSVDTRKPGEGGRPKKLDAVHEADHQVQETIAKMKIEGEDEGSSDE